MADESVKNTVNKRNEKGQFTKGNNEGNRKGRPKKGFAIADILNEIGDEIIVVNGEKITKRRAVMMKVFAFAVKGESWAVHFIADRTEGKAVERVIRQETDELIIIG